MNETLLAICHDHEVLHELVAEPIPITVPDTKLKHLENAPLKVALAQVRFAPVHAVEKPERVADFQKLLAESYVGRASQFLQTVTIQFGPAPAAPAAPAPETVWPFQDSERDWSVSLSSSSLALEAGTYDDFEAFLAEFSAVLSALTETFHPRQCTRLGLRYVNEITDGRLQQDRGLERFLRAELIAPIGTELGSDVLGSLCEVRFNEALGTLVLRHGLIRPNTYLLDFDYFREHADPFNDELITKTVENFHDLIEPLFVWCLSETYLTELKETRDAR